MRGIYGPLLVMILVPDLSVANPHHQEAASQTKTPERVSAPIVVRDFGTSKLRLLTDRIDRLLGTEREDENKSASTLRLFAENRWSEGYDNTMEFNARLMLKLETVDRWATSVRDWFDQRVLHLRQNVLRNQNGEIDSSPQGLDEASENVLAPDEEQNPWRFSWEHRVRLSRSNPYDSQAILSRDFEGQTFLHHFEWRLGWSVKNQWESRSLLISNLELSSELLFQITNSAAWQFSGNTFSTGHSIMLAYSLATNQALSLIGTLSSSIADRVWAAQVYVTTMSYRLQAYEDWIFFSFSPFLSFDRKNDFRRAPGFVANLEFVF